MRPGKSLVRGLVRTSCAPVEKRLLRTACAPVAVHKTFCGTVLVRVLCASWVLQEVVLCDLVRGFFMVGFFSVRYSRQNKKKRGMAGLDGWIGMNLDAF